MDNKSQPDDLGRIHLVRIRPATNERRFYTLEAGRDLFGPALIRQWGRIGRSCRQKLDAFPSDEATRKAMRRLSARKRRRGYHDVPWCAPTGPMR
jgi:predicted DNA-binding WGR domain protein